MEELTDKQKIWVYDETPTIKSIIGQDGDQLFEVRPSRPPRSIRVCLAGVGSTIREAIENAMSLQ